MNIADLSFVETERNEFNEFTGKRGDTDAQPT
jgi:hypothetical protein